MKMKSKLEKLKKQLKKLFNKIKCCISFSTEEDGLESYHRGRKRRHSEISFEEVNAKTGASSSSGFSTKYSAGQFLALARQLANLKRNEYERAASNVNAAMNDLAQGNLPEAEMRCMNGLFFNHTLERTSLDAELELKFRTEEARSTVPLGSAYEGCVAQNHRHYKDTDSEISLEESKGSVEDFQRHCEALYNAQREEYHHTADTFQTVQAELAQGNLKGAATHCIHYFLSSADEAEPPRKKQKKQ